MDDKTTAMIEKLSEKLGTTAEHLWGVLLHQAPISGAVDLAIIGLIILSAVRLVRFVKGKTTNPDAEFQNNEGAILAWIGTYIYLIIIFALVIGSAQDIVAAFLNPEYWALSHILGKV